MEKAIKMKLRKTMLDWMTTNGYGKLSKEAKNRVVAKAYILKSLRNRESEEVVQCQQH